MITDRINRQISRMKSIHKLESIKSNKEQQEKADESFRMVVNRACGFSRALSFASQSLDFSVSESLLNDIRSLLSEMKGEASSDFVDGQSVKGMSTRLNKIERQMATEWAEAYPALASVRETLYVVEEIDPEEVGRCLSDLKAAEAWTNDMSVLGRFSKALSDSEALIGSLNIDKKVILFLRKIADGSARLSDVNDDVKLWLEKESLEGRVKLTFVS